MPMLLIGCDGGTNATSGVVPEITRKLYDLTPWRRKFDEARDLQYRLLRCSTRCSTRPSSPKASARPCGSAASTPAAAASRCRPVSKSI